MSTASCRALTVSSLEAAGPDRPQRVGKVAAAAAPQQHDDVCACRDAVFQHLKYLLYQSRVLLHLRTQPSLLISIS